jgi:exodeoxyribonuclease VII small subunit
MQQPDDIASLSYEAALGQLDALIDKLERGSIPLEEAIAAYERGAKLAQHCAALLDRTERRVNQLVVGADGAIAERPLQVDAAPPAETSSRSRPPRPDPDDIPF